ncbi:MAG: hypothetical protein AAGJ46_07990 [Planctomycetota bacterium]
MADAELIQRVTDLVANTTLTDQQIARRLGANAETVTRVASKVLACLQQNREALVRCGGCGGLVLGFCRRCAIAASQRGRRPLATPLTSRDEVTADSGVPAGNPTPDEIAAATARIRAGWPVERLQAAESAGWRPPVPISLGQLADAADTLRQD